MSESPQIKASDCFFAAQVVVGERTSDTAKSAPIKVIARSGDAINHHVWGRVVHDFAGMRHNGRVTLDYNHNPNEVVGYANRISADSGDLELSGALTPFKDSDRATEIVHKSTIDRDDGGGVPYEASINFRGDMKVEYLDEGETETINGREFSGPLTIIREWPLRGCAITPYGYDPGTSATALSESDRDISVTVIEKEPRDVRRRNQTRRR